MSERTAENQKLELTMAGVLVIVVAMLALPIAISLFREAALVSFLIQSAPFVLIATAVASMIWTSKKER